MGSADEAGPAPAVCRYSGCSQSTVAAHLSRYVTVILTTCVICHTTLVVNDICSPHLCVCQLQLLVLWNMSDNVCPFVMTVHIYSTLISIEGRHPLNRSPMWRSPDLKIDCIARPCDLMNILSPIWTILDIYVGIDWEKTSIGSFLKMTFYSVQFLQYQ